MGNPVAVEFDLGHLPACLGCRHSPGEHAIGHFPSDPQPCEVPGCPCEDLVTPASPIARRVRDFPGASSTATRPKAWRVG